MKEKFYCHICSNKDYDILEGKTKNKVGEEYYYKYIKCSHCGMEAGIDFLYTENTPDYLHTR